MTFEIGPFEEYATEQDLDPVMKRFDAEYIENAIGDNRGFYAIFVNPGHGLRIGISNDGYYCMCVYTEQYEFIEGADRAVSNMDHAIRVYRAVAGSPDRQAALTKFASAE